MLELFPELYQETLRLFAAMACGEMAAGDAPVESTMFDSLTCLNPWCLLNTSQAPTQLAVAATLKRAHNPGSSHEEQLDPGSQHQRDKIFIPAELPRCWAQQALSGVLTAGMD